MMKIEDIMKKKPVVFTRVEPYTENGSNTIACNFSLKNVGFTNLTNKTSYTQKFPHIFHVLSYFFQMPSIPKKVISEMLIFSRHSPDNF